METLYQEQEALPNTALSCHSALISNNIPLAYSASNTLTLLLFHKHAKLLPASEPFLYCSLCLEHPIPSSSYGRFPCIIQTTLTICKLYLLTSHHSPIPIPLPCFIPLVVFVISENILLVYFPLIYCLSFRM